MEGFEPFTIQIDQYNMHDIVHMTGNHQSPKDTPMEPKLWGD